MNQTFKTILFEEKDDIGYVILNDPPANKMTRLFFQEINLLVRQQIVKSKVKGIIITGQGRHFSSGADIEQLREQIAPNTKLDELEEVISYPLWFVENRTTFNFFYSHFIPVISAINGVCVGSGLELALSSHIRICGNGSIMGSPESTFGFLPGVCGTIRALELLGLGKALEVVFNGETFSAEEALKLGFVDRIVNKKETLAYCENLMRYILNKPTNYLKQNGKLYVAEFNQTLRD